MAAKRCSYCEKFVAPSKDFSWAWFLFFCLTGIGGILYILYYLFFKSRVCPICKNKI